MKATQETMNKFQQLHDELAFYMKEIEGAIREGNVASEEWFAYCAKGVQADIDRILGEPEVVECPADCQCKEIDANGMRLIDKFNALQDMIDNAG